MLNPIVLYIILYLLFFFIPFFLGMHKIRRELDWGTEKNRCYLFSTGYGLIGTGFFLILFAFSINYLENSIEITKANLNYFQIYSDNLTIERNVVNLTGDITYSVNSFDISLAVIAIGLAIAIAGWSYIANVETYVDENKREKAKMQQVIDREQQMRIDEQEHRIEDQMIRSEEQMRLYEEIERKNKQEYDHYFFKILKKY